MAVGVLTSHALAPSVDADEAKSLLTEISQLADQIVKMAQAETAKPPAAIKMPRLRQIAEELGELFDLLRIG